MRILALFTLLALASLAVGADSAALLREFSDERLNMVHRDRLVPHLAEAPFPEVAVRLIQLMYAPLWNGTGFNGGFSYEGRASWPAREQIRTAAGEVWRRQMKKAPDGVLAETLMQAAENLYDPFRADYLRALRERMYRPELEPRLVKLAEDPSTPIDVAVMAAHVLIAEADLNRHLPRFIAVCQRLPADKQAYAFRDGGNLGNRWKLMTAENRQLFLQYGFGMLEKAVGNEAYSLAGHLGSVLKVQGVREEFAPSMKEHSTGGDLRPEFFTQTVENALEWWRSQPQ